MKIRALIVDDEALARERLQSLLRKESDFDLVAECDGGETAINTIKREWPDLVLLDVEMPRVDGFGVLRALPRRRWPAVIFTTGHNEHALHTFDVNALDYLLKPITHTRFKEALQRAREYFAHAAARDGVLEMSSHAHGRFITRIIVRTGEKVVIVKTSDIDAIESAGNYVAVQCGKESHILRDTLCALEAQLDTAKFMRVSRSAIVNLSRVKEIQPLFDGEHVVVLQNGKRITMTRRLREVEEALKFS